MPPLFGFLRSLFVSRETLVFENLALRQQLAAYKRTCKRPRLRMVDRTFWVWLSKLWRAGHDRIGHPYEKVYIHPAQHATYYPRAETLSIKLLFSPADGGVLGAQIVGREGVDKRIDVLATAIHSGMTVYDLEELELAYAPPFGAAKDPINMAGFVAGDLLKGDVQIRHADELAEGGEELIDVRAPEEHAEGSIPGSRNIPLDELRGRLAELPLERPLVVYCQVGLRGYVAARILKQHGYAVCNLSGGYTTYRAYFPEAAAD